jgi:hypothetical protein
MHQEHRDEERNGKSRSADDNAAERHAAQGTDEEREAGEHTTASTVPATASSDPARVLTAGRISVRRRESRRL